jgi:lambda family phage portal protein
MKFSLFNFDVGDTLKRELRTGSAIQSSVARPGDAELLRGISRRMARMYEAATTTNLNLDQGVSITSANAEILVSISAARSRARKLERDNPYAWAIIEGFQNDIGGEEPFRLDMKVGTTSKDGVFVPETDTNQEIQEAWEEAGLPENCTVAQNLSRCEMDWQAISAMVRDGGYLLRKHEGFPNNEFFFAVEPIEIDRLDHHWNRPATGTANEIQFSIEMNQWHAAVAYWILTRHPGDIYAWANSPKYRERVDAKDVIALFDIRTRAGQYVAVPRFSSIIARLHRIDQFDIAHVTAAIWASCKPFFLKRALPTASDYQGDQQSREGEIISNTTPATGEILPDGYEPVLVDPKFPIESSEAFKKEQLRAVASGSAAPYHQIGNDLEGVNFSSGRLGENKYHDTCKKLQRHMILNYRRPHFNAWLKAWLMSGMTTLPFSRYKEFVKAAKFIGRRWPYVNPLQDVQADILAEEAGFTSRDRIIQESDRGGDVETVNAEIAAGQKSDKAHGLDFSAADPTVPRLPKGTPGETVPNTESVMDGSAAARPGGKQTIGKALIGSVRRGVIFNGQGH